MKFRYPLLPELSAQATRLVEFANGGTQCHARLKDGTVLSGLLISNGSAIVAMRDQDQLLFPVDTIAELFQSGDDCNPQERGGWKYFDKWSV